MKDDDCNKNPLGKIDQDYLNKVEKLMKLAMIFTCPAAGAIKPTDGSPCTSNTTDGTKSLEAAAKRRKLSHDNEGDDVIFTKVSVNKTPAIQRVIPNGVWAEDEIKNGKMLTNDSISMASDMIKHQFEYRSFNGLNPTMDQYHEQPTDLDSIRNKLQIIHCRERTHWIAASNIGCQDCCSVDVYDSVFTSLDPITIEVIKNHFPDVKPFQKQVGGTDCGLFAIAVITAISYDEDPSKLHFIQEEMRSHLLNCFKNNVLTPFPCTCN